jgi:carboxylesterase type B
MYYSRASTSVPFAKAILESGATTARATFYPTHPRHLLQFREFLVAAGIEGVPESDIFPTLRTLPAATILKASKVLWDKYVPSVTWPFQPVIDGTNALSNSSHSSAAVIPDLPLLSWQQGHHLNIPVLTGFNTNEGTQFIPAKANTTAEFRSFFSALIPGFGPSDLDAVEALYPDPVIDPSSPYKAVPEGMGAQWARLDAAYSHYAYICPVLQTAHFLSTSSPSSHSNPSFSKSAHNSYGLRSTVGEASSPKPAAEKQTSSSNPSTSSAHNSYGLARSVGEATTATSSSSSSGNDNNNNSPVYVYHYAAASKWGTANHGDEAPVVAHDMLVISPPPASSSPSSNTTVVTRPGLRKVADAMHGAWVNFIVSPSGNPSPVVVVGESDKTWPVFVSPFSTSSAGVGGGERRSGRGDKGQMIVFGEGNDERNPDARAEKSEGTPVAVRALTEWELERCRFWWERVELSEGVGRRLDRGRL